jgi:hypothetical protein
MIPLELLRHHVSGAIERGEAQAIECVPVINKAQEAMDFINASTNAGQTVYISTMTKAVAFSPKTIAKFSAVGHPAFKLTPSGLYMAQGKRYVKIATHSMNLVGISAS